MKKLILIILVVFCISLAGSVLAEPSVTLIPIDSSEFQPAGVAVAKSTCQVGNLNPPFNLISGLTGPIGYSYYFNPAEQACECTEGIKPTAVTIPVHFPDNNAYPLSFDAFVDMKEGVLSESDCWVPGPDLCVGETYTITINSPGNYAVTLPIICDCAYIDSAYFLSFHFIDEFDAWLALDQNPLTCTAYENTGEGWVDYNGVAPGVLPLPVILGDAVCCSQPVGTDNRTWGSVKQLYR
jgi:hypothetical protein